MASPFPFDELPGWIATLLHATRDHVVFLDDRCRMVYHNHHNGPEVIGRCVSEFFSEEQFAKYRRIFDDVVSRGEAESFDIERLDGAIFQVTIVATGPGFPEGIVAMAIGIDFTDQSRASVALEATTLRYKAMLEALPDLVFLISPEGRYLDFYAGAPGDLYLSPSQFMGRTIEEVLPGEVANLLRHHLARARRGEPAVFEYSLDISSEKGARFEGRMAACGENVLTVVRNVTERARAIESLRRSEARLSAIVDALPGGVVQVTRDGELMLINRSAHGYYGMAREQFANMQVRDFERLTIGEDFAPYPASEYPVSRCFRSGKTEGPAVIGLKRPNGGIFWAVYLASPLFEDDSGAPTSAVVTFFDISERKELEEQLRQSQKMEAIGHLAGGVAHDFNNLLCAMMGFAQLAKRKAGDNDETRANIDKVLACGERAEALTKQLLAFSRKQVLEKRLVNLVTEAEEFGTILRRLLGEKIDIRITSASPYLAVRADPVQVQQILLNLALNARDAMPGGGRLSIDLRSTSLSDADLAEMVGGRGETTPGEFVALRVEDTGTGISSQIMPRIFDPFFTTKERNQGTGLGLSTVFGIVRQHGGAVRVESSEGSGTAFEIYLARSTEDAPVRGETDKFRQFESKGERILVVEDQQSVREFVECVLSTNGYSVVSAETPERALEILRSDKGQFDLLLTDVVMPGMKGPALYRLAREISPRMKVQFMSGYPEGELEEIADPGALLRKPFSIETLLEAVGARLETPISS